MNHSAYLMEWLKNTTYSFVFVINELAHPSDFFLPVGRQLLGNQEHPQVAVVVAQGDVLRLHPHLGAVNSGCDFTGNALVQAWLVILNEKVPYLNRTVLTTQQYNVWFDAVPVA